MEAIKFTEWIAENHFILYNKTSEGIYIWKNEERTLTTNELYLIFKLECYF